ncbi:MAG: DNA polymerase I [Proteobacteria bacterium]|nr:DNA polymerase I [Pseudomonadota bacterium]
MKPQQEETLYLIDVMSMAFRHYHALTRVHSDHGFFTSAGFPTSAIFGIIRGLFNLYSQEKPHYLVAACDSKETTFRHQIYSEYKANRKDMPEELAEQIPKIFELFHLLGVPVVVVPGCEADDIIATLARKPNLFFDPPRPSDAPPLHIRVITNDKDMMQLVNEHIRICKPKNNGTHQMIGTPEVIEYFGVPPNKVIPAQALIGDPSDHIPGVAGIGKVTAAKLLKNFSSLDEVYENIESFSGKSVGDKLNAGKENAYISEQLVTLKDDLELSVNLHDARVNEQSWGESNRSLFKFVLKCEFNSIQKRYFPNLPPPSFVAPFSPHGTSTTTHEEEGTVSDHTKTHSNPLKLVFADEELEHLIAATKEYSYPAAPGHTLPPSLRHKALSSHMIFFSCYTAQSPNNSSDDSELVFVIHFLLFAVDPKTAILSPEPLMNRLTGSARDATQELMTSVQFVFSEHGLKSDGDNQISGLLCDILFQSQVPIVTYDGKTGMHLLAKYGFQVQPYVFCDLQVIEGLVLARESSKHLIKCAQRELAVSPLLRWRAGDALNQTYGILASFTQALLYVKFYQPSYRISEMNYVLHHIETPLSYILFKMERMGVYLDRQLLADLSLWLTSELDRLTEEIHSLAGTTFNIQSPQQLGKVIYQKLRLHEIASVKLGKTKKSDNFSTRESALLKLLPNPLISHILSYRKLAKIKNTYADALPELVSKETGRLHTSFNQMGTVTGRMSSERPNLQNIPIRSDLGKEIRRAFRAEHPHQVMISADYSQIELRVLAHLCQDPNLMEAFNSDKDIHMATAAQMLRKTITKVTPRDRDMAKAINYGIIYGMGAKKLAKIIQVSVGEASSLIKDYFNGFKGVADYMESMEKFVAEQGYTLTFNGRMRTMDGDHQGRGKPGTARNSPIQGTAADLMKMAMIKVDQALEESQLPCRMLLQIHDELLFECDQDSHQQAMLIIRKEMEDAENFSVPLKVSIGVGKNWLEAH